MNSYNQSCTSHIGQSLRSAHKHKINGTQADFERDLRLKYVYNDQWSDK